MKIDAVTIKIFATFFLLNCLGMLFADAIMTGLLYRHHLRSELNHAEKKMSIWAQVCADERSGAAIPDKQKMLLLRESLGANCREIFFVSVNGDEVTSGNTVVKPAIVGRVLRTGKVERWYDENSSRPILPLKAIAPVWIGIPVGNGHGIRGGFFAMFVHHQLLGDFLAYQKFVLPCIVINSALLSMVFFVRYRRISVRPLQKLVEEIDQFSEGKGIHFITSPDLSEFRRLSLSLHSMIKKISVDKKTLEKTVQSLKETNEQLLLAQKEIIHAEKLASVGRLSSGLAHEIGNPISIIRGYLEICQDDKADRKELIEYLAICLVELDRIDNLIRQLLRCSRPPKNQLQAVHAMEILRNVKILLADKAKGIDIGDECDEQQADDLVYADGEQLYQVYLNCLINAADAIKQKGGSDKGHIGIRCRNEMIEGKKFIEIAITDNGIGIDAGHLEFIFEPFFTTKEPGMGTGLGLAVSRSIIHSFGGKIQIESKIHHGATVSILLPAYTA